MARIIIKKDIKNPNSVCFVFSGVYLDDNNTIKMNPESSKLLVFHERETIDRIISRIAEQMSPLSINNYVNNNVGEDYSIIECNDYEVAIDNSLINERRKIFARLIRKIEIDNLNSALRSGINRTVSRVPALSLPFVGVKKVVSTYKEKLDSFEYQKLIEQVKEKLSNGLITPANRNAVISGLVSLVALGTAISSSIALENSKNSASLFDKNVESGVVLDSSNIPEEISYSQIEVLPIDDNNLVETNIVSSEDIMDYSQDYYNVDTDGYNEVNMETFDQPVINTEEVIPIYGEPTPVYVEQETTYQEPEMVYQEPEVSYNNYGSDVYLEIDTNKYDAPKADTCRRDYGDIVTKYANMYGVDPDLAIAIATQEQGFHTTYMKNGSTGLFQLLNSACVGGTFTAYNFITKQYDSVYVTSTNIGELETNVQVACMILRQGYEMMNHNILAAIQSFNFGPYGMIEVIRDYCVNNNLESFYNLSSTKLSDVEAMVLGDYSFTGWTSYISSYRRGGDSNYLSHVLQYVTRSDNGERKIRFLNEDGTVTEFNIINTILEKAR